MTPWHGRPLDDAALAAWLDAADLDADGDRLLLTLLERAIVADPAVERLLTGTRRLLLARAAAGATLGRLLPLVRALAQQCFLTEYVYAETAAEQAGLPALRAVAAAALAHAGALSPDALASIALLASYAPLHALPEIDRLLEPDARALAPLIDAQVLQPRGIAALEPLIPSLTAVAPSADPVRAQYEQNPYPRWVDVPASEPAPLADVLGTLFPHARLPPALAVDPAVLIAGCGTGQHALETARRFVGARVLAIDISRASLAYAAYRTRALGAGAITYGQADLQLLPGLGRRFDVVESVGVLHHLEDPAAGWQALCDVLAPDGVMKVGLYSERARAHIVRTRARIAADAVAPTAEGIRGFRQRLLVGPDVDAIAKLSESPDFYSVSGCRDLLFHAREHRFTLPRLGFLIERLGLAVIGLEVPEATRDAFRAMFPDPRALADLAAWDAFEAAHPGAFRGMYQLWLRHAA